MSFTWGAGNRKTAFSAESNLFSELEQSAVLPHCETPTIPENTHHQHTTPFGRQDETPVTNESRPFDAELRFVLDTTINSVDTTTSPPDEIAKGPQLLGMRTWDNFLDLDETHLSTLQKKANHKLVDTSPIAENKIVISHNLILDSEGNDASDWDDPSWYAQDLHR